LGFGFFFAFFAKVFRLSGSSSSDITAMFLRLQHFEPIDLRNGRFSQ
jgi:hypothetical protein